MRYEESLVLTPQASAFNRGGQAVADGTVWGSSSRLLIEFLLERYELYAHSDDESLTLVMTSDSVFQPDQDTNTMLSAAPTASVNTELSLATLSTSLVDHSTFTSQEGEESATVASGGSDHSGQMSSVDSSLSWANP